MLFGNTTGCTTLKFTSSHYPSITFTDIYTLKNYLLTYLLPYWLSPWSRALLEKLTGFQLVKKFPTFYGTRRFITAFTSARHLSLSWARSIRSMHPHPTSWRSILILFSQVMSFHLVYPPKSCIQLSSLPTCHMPHPSNSSRSAHPHSTGEQYRSLSFSLCSYLHHSVTSLLLGSDISLSTLLSNTLKDYELHISFMKLIHVSLPRLHPQAA